MNIPDPATPLIALDAIVDGGFAEVEAAVDGEPESIILHRAGSAVRAWINVCPHAGRRLDWAPGPFLQSTGWSGSDLRKADSRGSAGQHAPAARVQAVWRQDHSRSEASASVFL